MAETQESINWLDKELEGTSAPLPYEKLPALKLIPNKVTEMQIDFSKPFYKWEDKVHKSIKAIIPAVVNGTRLNWWVNTKNPIYRIICEKGKAGTTNIKVVQTGIQADTKYNLVD